MRNLYAGNEYSTVSLVYLQCMDAIGQAWARWAGKTSYHGYLWYVDAILD